MSSDRQGPNETSSTEFFVGGLTPEQRRNFESALIQQQIQATWLGASVTVGTFAAPQVQHLLDMARAGRPPTPHNPYAYPGPQHGYPSYGKPQYVYPGSGYPQYPNPSYGGYGYPAPQRTNGLAIASLVLGIVAVFTCYIGVVAGIAAVVLGLVARRQIRERDERGAGLALAGALVGGLAALFIVAVLVFVVSSGGGSSGTITNSRVIGPQPRSMTPSTLRPRTFGTGPTVPAAGTTTRVPSGNIRPEQCGHVQLAYRNLVEPENTDRAIVADAARTLHGELPLDSADDIDLVLSDALARAGRSNTGSRTGDVQAAIERLAGLVDAGCP